MKSSASLTFHNIYDEISETYLSIPELTKQHSHCTIHCSQSNLPVDPIHFASFHILIFDIQPSAAIKLNIRHDQVSLYVNRKSGKSFLYSLMSHKYVAQPV